MIGVAGELDTFGAQGFRDRLGAVQATDRLIVDLGEVTFVDSAGLHALFGVVRCAKDVGALVVFVVPGDSPVRRVLELVQLADVSPVCESVRMALERLPGLDDPGLDGTLPG